MHMFHCVVSLPRPTWAPQNGNILNILVPLYDQIYYRIVPSNSHIMSQLRFYCKMLQNWGAKPGEAQLY